MSWNHGYFEGYPALPSRVWFSTVIYASQFTLCLLSLTPQGSKRLKYISRIQSGHICTPDQGLQEHCQWISITGWKFTWSCPPSSSPNLFNPCLQVHLQTHIITSSKCITRFTWLPSSGSAQISLRHHLQPVKIFSLWMDIYIDTWKHR